MFKNLFSNDYEELQIVIKGMQEVISNLGGRTDILIKNDEEITLKHNRLKDDFIELTEKHNAFFKSFEELREKHNLLIDDFEEVKTKHNGLIADFGKFADSDIDDVTMEQVEEMRKYVESKDKKK